MTGANGHRDPQTVVLGPYVDLHRGIHGSMLSHPPETIAFHQRGAHHLFLFPRHPQGVPEQAPFREPHMGEWVDFGPGPQVVHTARWPVVRRRAWVTDMDDFGYPLLLGRYAMNPALTADAATTPWTAERLEQARRRAASMLRAYAHPSCKAILLRTRHALDEAARWLDRLDLRVEGKPFLDKCRVLYPAQQADLPQAVEEKWSGRRPLRIVFIGSDYEHKNGRLALEVLQRLRERFPALEATYVGRIPEEELPLTRGIHHQPQLSRSGIRSLLRGSHVLFHPSKSESFGMVLLEAAAHGLAIVAARGRGMEHVEELLSERQALLVDRDRLAPQEEPDAFHDRLLELLSNPEKARRLGSAGYQVACTGELSLDHRNGVLADLYAEAEASPADSCVDDELEGGVLLRLDSERLLEGQTSFRRANRITRLNFWIEAGPAPTGLIPLQH